MECLEEVISGRSIILANLVTNRHTVVMKTVASRHVLGLLIALAGVVGCGNRAAPQPKYTAVGFRTATSDFAVSGGNLVVHPGKPGVMFGTVTKPMSSAQLSYVILFKLPPTTNESSLGLDGRAHREGSAVEAKSICTINGKRIEATSNYDLNEERAAVTNEKLTVGSKEVDPGAGRLFVVDLTTASPAYQQKKIALPDDVPKLEETADVERYAEVLLKHLQEKEPELKDWLK
jgi:hypothetical protein